MADAVSTDRTIDRRGVPIIVLFVAAASVAGLIAIAIGPFRADMAYRRGVQASNRGDSIAAEAQFSQAIDRHGWEPRYHTRLGIEYARVLDLRDPAQAAVARDPLLEALDLFPGEATATSWLEVIDARSRRDDG